MGNGGVGRNYIKWSTFGGDALDRFLRMTEEAHYSQKKNPPFGNGGRSD